MNRRQSAATDECYDAPRYWNLAFMDETVPEADFIEAVARKYCHFPLRNILEPPAAEVGRFWNSHDAATTSPPSI